MKKKKFCVYCNTDKNITGDHVPPQSWFLPEHKKDLFTVPACRSCNTDKVRTKCDEYVRDFLLIREDINQHIVDSSLHEKIVRGLRRNHKKDMEIFVQQTGKPHFLKTAGGLLVPKFVYTIDMNSFRLTFNRFIKALYWRETEQVLPNSIEVFSTIVEAGGTVRYIEDDTIRLELAKQLFYLRRDCPKKSNGSNLFSYHCHIDPNNQYETTWLFELYGVIVAFGRTRLTKSSI